MTESTNREHNGASHRMDPTFYRSAAEAVAAPGEKLAYVAAFDRQAKRPDALSVIDVDASSDQYGQVVGWADLPTTGDELHHFGWNACSSALMHEGHDMGPDGLQRRYLLLPGLRSSRVHVYDTQPDPRSPRLHKTIEASELAEKAGYSRPHTLHCGPDGVFLTCLGGADGEEGPGGIALLDHNSFDVLGAWEAERGPQYLAYDAWWHLNQNTLISSEWGTPSMIEDGIVPELLLGQKYGHRLHFWDLAKGRHEQVVDLGAENQMVLELRPSHDPEATWGFVGGTRTARSGRPTRSSPSRPSRQIRRTCRPRCSPSGRCHLSSPTSTCPSTTRCCTCPAGGPVSSSSTTSRTRLRRGRWGPSTSAASSVAAPTHPPRRSTSPAGRRWSR
jgi:hypothetical protein